MCLVVLSFSLFAIKIMQNYTFHITTQKLYTLIIDY